MTTEIRRKTSYIERTKAKIEKRSYFGEDSLPRVPAGKKPGKSGERRPVSVC